MPDKLRTLIVDDEDLARSILREYVGKVPSLTLAAECADAVSALEILAHQRVDLLLLDIQMPELSGLDLLNTLSHPPATILTTAHSNYALEGFEYGVVDYLLKPINFARFLKAVHRVPGSGTERRTGTLSPDYLEIKPDGSTLLLPLDKLLYLKSFGNYLRLVTAEKTYTITATMTSMEERLPAQFQRIHKSYLINLRHAGEMVGRGGILVGKKELPVSPLYRLLLLERLEKEE